MKDNDIQAFPMDYGSEGFRVEQGMTLRDYFAAKALNIVPFLAKELFQNPECWMESDMAEEAYRIADAMLKARK